MFLVMGITGKVGGATAEHLLAQGKKVRALVRNREKASSWANQGVELVDVEIGMTRQPSGSNAQRRRRRVCDVAGCLGPLARLQRSQGRDCELCRGAHQGSARRVVALSSMGANRTSGLRVITALSPLRARFSRPSIANRILCAQADSSKTSSTACRSPRAETLPVYYNPTNRKSTMVVDERHRREGGVPSDRAQHGQGIAPSNSARCSARMKVAAQLGDVLDARREGLRCPTRRVADSVRTISASRRATPDRPKKGCSTPWTQDGWYLSDRGRRSTSPAQRHLVMCSRRRGEPSPREPHRTHQKRSRSSMKKVIGFGRNRPEPASSSSATPRRAGHSA